MEDVFGDLSYPKEMATYVQKTNLTFLPLGYYVQKPWLRTGNILFRSPQTHLVTLTLNTTVRGTISTVKQIKGYTCTWV